MTVLAYITDEIVVEKILRHLRLPTEPLALSPARRLGQLELFEFDNGRVGISEGFSVGESEPWESNDRNRGPPSNDRQDPWKNNASSDTSDWGA